ncbi:MAG: hypothetical protein V4732_00320 [Pseudomonadota bacterium]
MEPGTPTCLGSDSAITTADAAADSTDNINDINIAIHPIFDETNPKENNHLYRMANKFHPDTHTKVIRSDLLFKKGDVFDEKKLIESERILRTRRYLNSAFITSSIDCNNKNVSVSVREVWTLVPQFSYSRSGGNSNYGFGLSDTNFLGTGKSLNIARTSTVLRNGNLLDYYDPNTGFFNSTLTLQFTNNDDGKSRAIALVKPFVALDNEWTGGISEESYTQEDTLYNAGEEADRFNHQSTSQAIFYGRKLDTGSRESIHRVVMGYNASEHNFYAAGVAPDTSVFVPEARQFSYPWVEYQHVTDGYFEANNIQQINRVEDINLGAQVRFRLGYTASKYNHYDKDLMYEAEYSQGVKISEKQLLLASTSSNGFYDGDNIYNNIISSKVSYHWQNFKHSQFFVNLSAANGVRLFSDLPLELGGDTGLRGYPIRYQAGDKLQLMTIEQRFFGQKEWFALFHLGAAIFYDQGRVIGTSAIPQEQQGWLRDVGIGLRFSGTRTGNREEGTHNILHIDLAAPLDGSNDIEKLQWLVTVKNGF